MIILAGYLEIVKIQLFEMKIILNYNYDIS